MPRTGILFILVGPSGAGKSTLLKHVQQRVPGLPQLATVTTRRMRDDEQQGREHLFVTRAEFIERIEAGALLEHQPVHVGDLYGTPRQPVEDAVSEDRDLIADIDVLGALKIREAYPDNTVLIFVTPSNLDILTERIRQRGRIRRAELADRLERARFELAYAPRCDHLILNDIVEPAAEHLRQIVLSERHRQRGDATGLAHILERPTFHSTAVALLQHRDRLLVQMNGKEILLPSFALQDFTRAPHETLAARIDQAWGLRVDIHILSDERFEFGAPHHVTLAALPHDAYLYYYYTATVSGFRTIDIPDWEWRPVSDLKLPSRLRALLTS